jgi:hypothetical protein
VDESTVFVRKRLETNPVTHGRKTDETCLDMQESSRDLSLPFSLLSTRDVPILVLFNDTCRHEPVAFKILELS